MSRSLDQLAIDMNRLETMLDAIGAIPVVYMDQNPVCSSCRASGEEMETRFLGTHDKPKTVLICRPCLQEHGDFDE